MHRDTASDSHAHNRNHPGGSSPDPAAKDDTFALSPEQEENHLRICTWRATLQGFLRQSRGILKESKTTTLEYHGMLEIWIARPESGLSVGALAKRIHVRHNTAVEVVNGLCRKGWATRTRSDVDQRVANVQLTSGGRRMLAQLVDRHLAELRKLVGDFRKALD